MLHDHTERDSLRDRYSNIYVYEVVCHWVLLADDGQTYRIASFNTGSA
jgi:hypothetical protein